MGKISKKNLDLIPRWLYERGLIDRKYGLMQRDFIRDMLKSARNEDERKRYAEMLDSHPDLFTIEDVIRLIKEIKR